MLAVASWSAFSMGGTPVRSPDALTTVTNALTTVTNALTTVTNTQMGSATMWSVESFGPEISLNQATSLIKVNIAGPTNLPDSLSMSEVRGNSVYVVLIYQSPILPTLQNWDTGSMIIWIARDNTTYHPVSSVQVVGQAEMTCNTGTGVQDCSTISSQVVTVTQTTVVNVLVGGNPGVGSNPQGQDGIGDVTWWNNGIHYTIDADLPLSTLVSIGASMGT